MLDEALVGKRPSAPLPARARPVQWLGRRTPRMPEYRSTCCRSTRGNARRGEVDGRPSGLPSGVFAWAAPRGLQRSSSIVLPSWSGGSNLAVQTGCCSVPLHDPEVRPGIFADRRISPRGHLEAEPGKPHPRAARGEPADGRVAGRLDIPENHPLDVRAGRLTAAGLVISPSESRSRRRDRGWPRDWSASLLTVPRTLTRWAPRPGLCPRR